MELLNVKVTNNISIAKRLEKLSNVGVIVIGPKSCLYKFNSKSNFFLCETTNMDYVLESVSSKVLSMIETISKYDDLQEIILFAGCCDYIAQIDYNHIIKKAAKITTKHISFIQRGPLAQQQTKSRETIESISNRINKTPTVERKTNTINDNEILTSYNKAKKMNIPIILLGPGSCTDAIDNIEDLSNNNLFYYTKISQVELSLGCIEQLTKIIINKLNEIGYSELYLINSPIIAFIESDFQDLKMNLENEKIKIVT